jgi:hypothetical protein
MPGDCPASLLSPGCWSVENIPLQAERHFGSSQRLFGLPPESVFSFRPECCSASQRNGVQLPSGIAFTFDRIPQLPLQFSGRSGLCGRLIVFSQNERHVEERSNNDVRVLRLAIDY